MRRLTAIAFALLLWTNVGHAAITLQFSSENYAAASSPLDLLLPENITGTVVLDPAITDLANQSLTVADVFSYEFETFGRTYDEAGTYTSETLDINFDANGDVSSFSISLVGNFEGGIEQDRVLSWASSGNHAVEFGIDDWNPGRSIQWTEWAVFEGSTPSIAAMWTASTNNKVPVGTPWALSTLVMALTGVFWLWRRRAAREC